MTATLERTVLPDVIEPVFFGHTWQRGDDGLFVLPDQTLGWAVAYWCYANLLGPDGNPWVFTDEQLRFVLWMYAVDDNGNFLYREIVLQRLKGWGKDPLAAVLCAVELIGPCRADMDAAPVLDPWGNEHPAGREHPQAWVEVAAVSREQTSNTMSIFPGLFTKACRQRYRLSIGKTYVTALAGQRRLRAVTSSWRSLEGGRPTFQVQNEALALDTPIPTPAGWRTMGELVTGDAIYADDGSPCSVVEAKPVQTDRRCFEVAFVDGTSITASDGHLWQTRVASSQARPRIRTTLEMVEDGRRFAVPRAGIRQSPPASLSVDPYLLGVWLGDGSTGDCNITVGDEDMCALEANLAARGVATHRLRRASGRAGRLGFSGRSGFGAQMGTDLSRAFRSLSCFLDKHIPRAFMEAGTEQRLELLRGLMDTDGCLSGNRAIFVGSQKLCLDVLELVRSLGQLATITRAPDSRSRAGATWRVTFTPRGIQPFALPRKADRVRSTRRSWVLIKSIVEVGSVPVRCIEVDSSTRLFQAGEAGHVTHNTQHWRQNNEGHEMAAVMERNATKAADGNTKTFKITNAYEPSEDSVAQQDREAWEDEQDPDVDAVATGVMYDSIEAPPDAIMIKPRDVEEADFVAYLERVVSAVRGDSWWLKPRVIVQAILHRKNPVSRSRRFYFNQIVAAEDAWLDPLAVAAAVHELIDKATWQDDVLRSGWGLVGRDEPCVMFFDGSKSDDETALVGCRLSDLYEFVLGVWHRPAGMKRDEHWQVDRGAVDERIDEVFGRFNIVAFWGDPGGIQDDVDDQQYWIPSFDKWHRKYRDRLQMWATKTGPKAHSVLWDMRSRERNALFTEAAEEFVSAIQNRNEMEVYAPTFRFDGHPRLRRHLTNARRFPNEHGVSLWKGHRESARKVDLAVCAVGARMLARFTLNKGLEETNSGELWGFRSGRTRTPRG